MKPIIIALLALALAGCGTTQDHARTAAYVKAAERTACMTALLVCNQLPDKPKCLKTAQDVCKVSPELVKLWSEATKPLAGTMAPAEVSP